MAGSHERLLRPLRDAGVLMAKTGKFLVLEGLDGAGTTTQSKILADRLRREGHKVHCTAEPSSGPIGSQLRLMLAGRLVGRKGEPWDRRSLALLFAADRLDHLASVIVPRLEDGVHVVCDLYVLSSLAYQSLDNPASWVAELNRHMRRADATYFLRIRAEAALARRLDDSGGQAELFETLPQQKRIARAYEKSIASHGRAQRVRIVEAPPRSTTSPTRSGRISANRSSEERLSSLIRAPRGAGRRVMAR